MSTRRARRGFHPPRLGASSAQKEPGAARETSCLTPLSGKIPVAVCKLLSSIHLSQAFPSHQCREQLCNQCRVLLHSGFQVLQDGMVMLCVGIRLLEESGDSVFSTGLLYLTACIGARELSVKLISLYGILQGAVFPCFFSSGHPEVCIELAGVQPRPGARAAPRGSAAFGLNSP